MRRFHITLMSGKMRQAVCRVTSHEGGGVFSPGMFAQRPGDRLQTSSRINTLTRVCLL